ncbi:MAG TPA: class I SAM-dependent methyltransferase [Candidatus Woesebacteria bacterium]|nr:class I SAM-dependent methyltransferase [Candidatus Woesebacteria bacterium]
MLSLLRQSIIQPIKEHRRQIRIPREALQAYAINKKIFPAKLILPVPFALGLNERPVELMLARLLYAPDKEILDMGHANAKLSHRHFLKELPGRRQITGIDIAKPGYDPRPYYKKTIRGDITQHAFEENSFDTIWCISTLEHIGTDVSIYADGQTKDADMAGRVLESAVRLLKPGGQLLLSVPYGRYEDLKWLINYDAMHWNHLLDVVRSQVLITEWYFRHIQSSGWQIVPPVELEYVGYHDQRNYGAAGLAAAILKKK